MILLLNSPLLLLLLFGSLLFSLSLILLVELALLLSLLLLLITLALSFPLERKYFHYGNKSLQ